MVETYYYKVVYKDDTGGFCSARTFGDFSLKYSIGEVTTPKVGKVFLFKKLKDAEEFRSWQDRRSYFIMKVEVIGHAAKCEARLEHFNNGFNDKYAKLFWKSANNPDGTWQSPKPDWWKGLPRIPVIEDGWWKKSVEVCPPAEYLGWMTGPVPDGSYLADAVRPVEMVEIV